jgi:hypothetical protein
VTKKLLIHLADGASLEVDQEQWRTLGSAAFSTLRGGAYVIARLAVLAHDDGRTVVYVEEQTGGTTTHAGELLDSVGSVEAAIHRVAAERNVPDHVAAECVASLHTADGA